MLDWLVITADQTGAGRGVRGQTLARFLRTYFGFRRVGRMTPEQWRKSPVAASTIFLGLPSSLTPEEIARLAASERCRRLVPYDYLDQQELAWTPEQEVALRPLIGHYLKPWFEPDWNYGLQMGMLPIRRYGRFKTALLLHRLTRSLGHQPQPLYDVAFLGRPNETRVLVNGRPTKVDQRFEWIRDLKRDAPDVRFWGGLVEFREPLRSEFEAKHGDISDLLHTERKVSFPEYFRAMRHSRVLLAPGGNVPWSYRHYEGLYAGAVVVTIDYRRRDMLVPLPRERMVHVPDGVSVIPAVREALELSRTRPTLGEENYAHLEQYLRFGAYSRRRPALIERFTAQLD